MDITEENITQQMLEKIAELDHSHGLLKDLNTEMRHWLDVADDDITALYSENTGLKKEVKALEKIISETQQVEAEPCRSLVDDNHSLKRRNEKKIQKLEKESTLMKEQNKNLTAELKSLQQERAQDKISLSKLKAAMQNFECGLEEAEVLLYHRDEAIRKKNLELKYLEETIQECSNTIENLRLMNRELRNQLENRVNEASFGSLNHLIGEKEGSFCSPLSFADEMKLLASQASDSTDLGREETEAEELQKPQSLTVNLQIQRCADAIQRARQFVLLIFVLTVLAFMASGGCTGNAFFSINTLWNSAHMMLQPYCRVHYGALPPI